MFLHFIQMTELDFWIPEIITESAGREFARISFMAPFMQLSVFAEDDVSYCLNL